jgi:hypothetical protein
MAVVSRTVAALLAICGLAGCCGGPCCGPCCCYPPPPPCCSSCYQPCCPSYYAAPCGPCCGPRVIPFEQAFPTTPCQQCAQAGGIAPVSTAVANNEQNQRSNQLVAYRQGPQPIPGQALTPEAQIADLKQQVADLKSDKASKRDVVAIYDELQCLERCGFVVRP